MTGTFTFLVADSDPQSRLLIREELVGEFGVCHVIEAGTVMEALERTRQRHPDAVLTDDTLASVDATVLMEGLRAKNFRGPLLLLTGNRNPVVHRRALAVGADGVFLDSEVEYLRYLRSALSMRTTDGEAAK